MKILDREKENYTCEIASKVNFVTQLTFRRTDGSRNAASYLKSSRSLKAF